MMSFSTTQIRRRYNQIAEYLPLAAAVDKHVSDNMSERLTYIVHHPLMIVDVGSGVGMATSKLTALYPEAHIFSLDVAEELLKKARKNRRVEKTFLQKIKSFWQKSHISYISGDMANMPFASDSVDMIWSNLVLPWQATPDNFFAECRRILKPNGLLMFSTLGVDSMSSIRQAFVVVDDYPSTHQFIDMHDLGDALLQYGFDNPVIDVERLNLTYTDVASLVQDFRHNAATNLHPKRRRNLLTPRLWKKIETAFDALRDQDGRISVEVEVVYGHAWRKPDSMLASDSSPQIIQFHPPIVGKKERIF